MEESKTPRRLPSSKKLDAARATLASERRAAHAYAQKAAIESERKARSVLKERSPPRPRRGGAGDGAAQGTGAVSAEGARDRSEAAAGDVLSR